VVITPHHLIECNIKDEKDFNWYFVFRDVTMMLLRSQINMNSYVLLDVVIVTNTQL